MKSDIVGDLASGFDDVAPFQKYDTRDSAMDIPETPEAIAVVLLALILGMLGDQPQSGSPITWVLDAYADCLSAARGERGRAIEKVMPLHH